MNIKKAIEQLSKLKPFIKDDFPNGIDDPNGHCATDEYKDACRDYLQALAALKKQPEAGEFINKPEASEAAGEFVKDFRFQLGGKQSGSISNATIKMGEEACDFIERLVMESKIYELRANELQAKNAQLEGKLDTLRSATHGDTAVAMIEVLEEKVLQLEGENKKLRGLLLEYISDTDIEQALGELTVTNNQSPVKPLTDEQLWGGPGKSAHEGPGRMSQEEIDDLILEETLQKKKGDEQNGDKI